MIVILRPLAEESPGDIANRAFQSAWARGIPHFVRDDTRSQFHSRAKRAAPIERPHSRVKVGVIIRYFFDPNIGEFYFQNDTSYINFASAWWRIEYPTFAIDSVNVTRC